jgi:hypothetical protein
MSNLQNGSMDITKATKAIIGMLIAKGVPAKMAVQQSEDIVQNCLVDCLEKDIPLTYGILRIGVKHGTQKIARSKERVSYSCPDKNGESRDYCSRKHSTLGQVLLNDAISRLAPDTEIGMVGNLMISGYKGFEIADMLGISPSTVCRRIEQVQEMLAQ